MPETAKSKWLADKKRYTSNSEIICAFRKQYYQCNTDKVKEAYKEDSEKFKKAYANNPEKFKEVSKKVYTTDPE